MKIRKLILFPIAGAAVALVAGFASPLVITGAPAMQVDTNAEDLSCATSASVSAWLYDDGTGKVEGARVRLLDDVNDDDLGDCAGNTLYVTPLNLAGTAISPAGHVHMTNSPPAGAGFDITGGYEWLVIFNGDSGTGGWATPVAGTNVQGSVLEGVRIAIDQGPHSAHPFGVAPQLWPN